MQTVRLRDLLGSPAETARFREVLRRGGVAAIPTETFYGLAADPRSEAAVARIFRIKKRDDGKALLVLFSEPRHLSDLGVVDGSESLDRYLRIWPAPLTVVLPLLQPLAASRGASTLAVRMPADAAVLELLSAVGPLTGTSANRSGAPALSDPVSVRDEFGGDLDYLVDGGPTPGGNPSTLLDATQTPPVVMRAGAFHWPPDGK